MTQRRWGCWNAFFFCVVVLPLIWFISEWVYERHYDQSLGKADWQLARLQYHFPGFKCDALAVHSVVMPMREISYYGGANLRMPQSCQDELRTRLAKSTTFALDSVNKGCYWRDVNGTVELCFERGEVYFGAGRVG